MEKIKVRDKIIYDISKELFAIGIRETDRKLIEDMARELKALIQVGAKKE